MSDMRQDAILQLLHIALSAINVAVAALMDVIDLMTLTEYEPVEQEE